MFFLVHALGFIASVLLCAFSAGVETCIYRVSRVRMRIRRDQGDRRASQALRLLDHTDGMVTTLLIGNNIANYVGTYFLIMPLMRWGVPRAELVTALILAPIFFILGESIPKQVAYNYADEIIHALAPAIEMSRLALSPVVWIVNAASTVVRRLLGIKGNVELAPTQRARLVEYFEAGVAEKILTDDQNRMARRIMELERNTAADVMIPNSRLLVLPERTSRAKAVEQLAAAKADLAMLADGAGRATGKVVNLGILVRNPGNPEDPVGDLSVELGRIKSGASLAEVLGWLRREHAQRAAVAARGRIIGVITSKSILARIAGI